MFDNVTFKLSIDEGTLRAVCDRDIYKKEYTFRNMKIRRFFSDHIVSGSLSTFLNGENCTPLAREGVKEAIHKLEESYPSN